MIAGIGLGDIAQYLADGVGNISGHDGVLSEILSGVVAGLSVDQDGLRGGKNGRGIRIMARLGKQGADQSRKAIARATGGHTAVAVRLGQVIVIAVRDDGAGVLEYAHGVILP